MFRRAQHSGNKRGRDRQRSRYQLASTICAVLAFVDLLFAGAVLIILMPGITDPVLTLLLAIIVIGMTFLPGGAAFFFFFRSRDDAFFQEQRNIVPSFMLYGFALILGVFLMYLISAKLSALSATNLSGAWLIYAVFGTAVSIWAFSAITYPLIHQRASLARNVAEAIKSLREKILPTGLTPMPVSPVAEKARKVSDLSRTASQYAPPQSLDPRDLFAALSDFADAWSDFVIDTQRKDQEMADFLMTLERAANFISPAQVAFTNMPAYGATFVGPYLAIALFILGRILNITYLPYTW